MEINHLSHALVALFPVLFGLFWYSKFNPLSKWVGHQNVAPKKIGAGQFLVLYGLSIALVFVFMNLVIHQIGFYELFFTDIMRGSTEAKEITETFLAKYGTKHRHFGHGIFHGAINGFALGLPFLAFFSIVEQIDKKRAMFHFGFLFLTSTLVGGLVAQFI